MGKLRNGKRNKTNVPFVAIPHDVLFHDKFRALSSSAKVVYLAMCSKVRAPLGVERYLYEIKMSYAELLKWGFGSNTTIKKAVEELVERGFLDVMSIGGLKGCNGTSNTYQLSVEYKK